MSELKCFLLGVSAMERFEMKRIGLCVSAKCNLKCKLCAAYAPYYENPVTFSIECLKQIEICKNKTTNKKVIELLQG